MSDKWAKIKASGSFRRQVKRKRDSLRNEIDDKSNAKLVCQETSNNSLEPNSSSVESEPSAGFSSLLCQNHPDNHEEDSVFPGDDIYFSPSEGEDDLPDMRQALSSKNSADIDEGKATGFAFFFKIGL